MILLHAAVNEIRNAMRCSHHGFYHICDQVSKKHGLSPSIVEKLFQEKYPNLYPLDPCVGSAMFLDKGVSI